MEKIICPICFENNTVKFIDLQDYFLSQEFFTIQKCENCGLKFTNPVPENLSKYYKSENYFSHKDKANNLTSYIYNLVRNISLKNKYKIIKEYTNDNILDIGCGTAEFLKLCSENGLKTKGVEPDENARKIALSKKLDVYENLEEIEIKDNKFQVITLWHVLEHIRDINEKLNLIKSILRPEGKLVIALPNPDSYDAEYYGKYWAAYDVPRHLYHFNKETFEKTLRKFGFNVIEILPMKFDAFYVSLLSEKYLNNSNLIKSYIKSILIGMKSNYIGLRNKNYSSLIYILQINNVER